MRPTRVLRSARLAAGLILLVATGGACGDERTAAEPSPAVVETALASSRPVSISSTYSTTPVAEDEGRDVAIVLDGRVFGSGRTGVILSHMRPADQTSWYPFALRLAGTGDYTVLTFDFRGYGSSTGDKEFDRVDTDLMAALRYMQGDLGLDRIFLVGASMGGTAALLVSASEPVAGVVSISAPAQYQLLDALATLPRIRAPKLFITSEDDVPAQRSQEQFWAEASNPKEQEIYPGDAHGTDILASPIGPQVEQRLLDFLTSH